VTVLDVRGRVVATLFDGALAAGPHRVAWRGLGPDLRPASSGVYFLRVEHAGESRTEKAVLLK
jgi:hypothetical protein